MGLTNIGFIDLPPHTGRGGFDHASVHRGTGRLYVAHTANSALDVIDCKAQRYLHSISGLPGVAGALVSEPEDLVFTSNRAENTVGILSAISGDALATVPVGVGPNGLAYDRGRHLLLAASVGDPAVPGSHTVFLVDVQARAVIGYIPVSGRTRWTVFDAEADAFYVNIANPAEIVVIEGAHPDHIHRTFPVPAAGPHGLDLDSDTHRLFCACDGKVLVALDARSGQIIGQTHLSGGPDVIFFNPVLRHLYVAIGDPGVIDVFDTDGLRRIAVIRTEPGAHTLGFDSVRQTIYAFLPGSHRAAVYLEEGSPVGALGSSEKKASQDDTHSGD